MTFPFARNRLTPAPQMPSQADYRLATVERAVSERAGVGVPANPIGSCLGTSAQATVMAQPARAELATARLAHDLRGHLQAATSYLYLIKTFEKDSPRFACGLAGLAEAVQHMVERLDARLPERIDLKEFLSTECQGFVQQCAPTQLRFAGDLTTELIVRASRARLRDAIGNLLRNARDAMSGYHGDPTIAVYEYDAASFPGGNLSPGVYAVIVVRDTGCGMDAGTLTAAGQDWFTRKLPGHGTGLGLSSVREFAHDAGGDLHLSSAPGQGTTAAIWLPVAMVPS